MNVHKYSSTGTLFHKQITVEKEESVNSFTTMFTFRNIIYILLILLGHTKLPKFLRIKFLKCEGVISVRM